MSRHLRICAEVADLAIDTDTGERCPAGICADFGEISEERYASVDYLDAVSQLDKRSFLDQFLLDTVDVSRLRFITPEEYDEKYGEETP